ncbi:MAG: Rrf2 family transcriptional regulator [Sedimentisphaerales bacterium]|nr:Rrf2 family transcriptional regulator [Sedimentisphaerales bacterium]
MKISKKCDYALRSLLALASEPDGLFTIKEIAQSSDISRRFLEQIMLDMKNLGWVVGHPGRDGGYKLAISPETLTVGMIVRHFDQMLAPIECVSVRAYEKCSQEKCCRFRRLFLNLRNQAAQVLDNTTLAD